MTPSRSNKSDKPVRAVLRAAEFRGVIHAITFIRQDIATPKS